MWGTRSIILLTSVFKASLRLQYSHYENRLDSARVRKSESFSSFKLKQQVLFYEYVFLNIEWNV